MTTRVADIVVIGGGPAGLTAAIETARAGARTVLVDDRPRLGGNFYKELRPSFRLGSIRPKQDPELAELHLLLEGLRSAGVHVLDETTVWGIFQADGASLSSERSGRSGGNTPGFALALAGPHPVRTLEASSIILAPGVFDRSMPFPGWTLPGVITPGGAQLLLKNQGVLPGHRILLAGTGPLLLAVAAALAEHGARVVDVLETSGVWTGWQSMPRALSTQWGRVREALGYGLTLSRQKTSLHYRQAVFRAVGKEHVEGVIVGRVDESGHPIPGTEGVLEVDTICVGYGFLPSTALTLHLGCQHVYHPDLRTHLPAHDKEMATSVSGIYVAGDITGMGGKRLARLQGRVAGLAASRALGFRIYPDVEEQVSRLRPTIASEERFRRMLWRRFRALPGLIDLLEDDTIVCRCEAVDAATILRAIREGERHIAAIKQSTRVGMGPCQGRYCTYPVTEIIARETGIPLDEQPGLKVRPPILPVRARDLL